jgi:hypothetical protein
MLNFVDDHQALQRTQSQHGIGQMGNGTWIFEIETCSWSNQTGQGICKCGFADLTGPNQSNDREAGQKTSDRPKVRRTLYHDAAIIP